MLTEHQAEQRQYWAMSHARTFLSHQKLNSTFKYIKLSRKLNPSHICVTSFKLLIIVSNALYRQVEGSSKRVEHVMAAGQRDRDLLEVLHGVPEVRRTVGLHSVYSFGDVRRKETSGTVYDVTHLQTEKRYACKVYNKEELRRLSSTEMQSRYRNIAQVCSA